jgi:hypothetical protein
MLRCAAGVKIADPAGAQAQRHLVVTGQLDVQGAAAFFAEAHRQLDPLMGTAVGGESAQDPSSGDPLVGRQLLVGDDAFGQVDEVVVHRPLR